MCAVVGLGLSQVGKEESIEGLQENRKYIAKGCLAGFVGLLGQELKPKIGFSIKLECGFCYLPHWSTERFY